ncbi:Serine/threonine-protein kinase pkn1 [Durusdinium trenchii]|uniref:Serine/threonine-protein kinase pkn1 n=1 Tax=Durusdinium trenchii TaxID=1381693 RepID=A0ABP0ISX6_9DINO
MAPLWDARLGGELNESLSEGSRFRTLVHGDAKPENILCNASSGHVECAALDFGWVGEGYGACDVAYLLWDQIASNVVQDSRAWKQEFYYYSKLLEKLPEASYTREKLQEHFDLCVMDFIRSSTERWVNPQ